MLSFVSFFSGKIAISSPSFLSLHRVYWSVALPFAKEEGVGHCSGQRSMRKPMSPRGLCLRVLGKLAMLLQGLFLSLLKGCGELGQFLEDEKKANVTPISESARKRISVLTRWLASLESLGRIWSKLVRKPLLAMWGTRRWLGTAKKSPPSSLPPALSLIKSIQGKTAGRKYLGNEIHQVSSWRLPHFYSVRLHLWP